MKTKNQVVVYSVSLLMAIIMAVAIVIAYPIHKPANPSTPLPSSQPPGITIQQVSVLQNLTTLSGKTYRNFRVQRVYSNGVLIRHEIKPGDLSLAVVKLADLDSATRKQMGI